MFKTISEIAVQYKVSISTVRNKAHLLDINPDGFRPTKYSTESVEAVFGVSDSSKNARMVEIERRIIVIEKILTELNHV